MNISLLLFAIVLHDKLTLFLQRSNNIVNILTLTIQGLYRGAHLYPVTCSPETLFIESIYTFVLYNCTQPMLHMKQLLAIRFCNKMIRCAVGITLWQ